MSEHIEAKVEEIKATEEAWEKEKQELLAEAELVKEECSQMQ